MELVTIGFVVCGFGADVSVNAVIDVVVSIAEVADVSAVLVETVVISLGGFVVGETIADVGISASVDVSAVAVVNVVGGTTDVVIVDD